MSIKTIDTASVGTDTGISKKINKGAEKLVFDILQSTQYSTPIPSTVRELVTNACDSQREKEIATEILTGVAQVEDYYIERHGEQYEDSNFNREYYDLNYFSDKNRIEIIYKKNEGVGFCDVFSITDYGVGIGGRRLEGVLELGYSTKRNTSQNFGAFGLGAKVALSTGVEYYTIETVYQGKRIKVNCYSYKTEFVIPKFNIKTGEINPSITLSDGSIVYYEPSTEKNFTTVSFGVKKHNYQRFKDAVSEQLTYFDNVDFKVIYEDGIQLDVSFKVPVIYNSDTLIVSESYYFNKPHVVIVKDVKSNNGINYGHIDFKELEMEQLYGAIGLKCPIRQSYVDENGDTVIIQEGVEVTPSREKVIWNDATKEYIQKVIYAASDEVTTIVEAELKETDFLKWINACKDVLYNTTKSNKVEESKRTVLSVLSNIIDTTELKPKYSLNPAIKFGSIRSFLCGFKLVSKKIKHELNKTSGNTSKTISIYGEDVEDWSRVGLSKLFVAEGSISRLKDYYLITQHEGEFFLLYPKNLDYLIDKINDPDATDIDKATATAEYKKLFANQQLILPLIKSSVDYRNYDEIEVPEGVSLSLLKEEELTDQDIRQLGVSETPEERRLRNSSIVVHGIRTEEKNRTQTNIWDKCEPILNDVIFSETPTYYGTAEDSELLLNTFKLIKHNLPAGREVFYTYYSDDRSKTYSYWDCLPLSIYSGSLIINLDTGKPSIYEKAPQIIKVSQNNVKHLQLNKNAKPIEQFYYDVTDSGALTAHKSIKVKMTIYMFNSLSDVSFEKLVSNFGLYKCSGVHSVYKQIDKLINTVDLYGSSIIHEEFYEMYKRWASFQKLSKTANEDEIEQLAESLLLFSDIRSVEIYDEELLDLLLYIKEVYSLINILVFSMHSGYETDESVVKELDLYMKVKGVYDVSLPGNCSTLNELDKVLQTKINTLI